MEPYISCALGFARGRLIMTPQERQLVDELFDRLSKLENAPRDPDAIAAISDGLRKAPGAIYALVQTTLLQDEALKRAHNRIQELEAAHAPEQAQSGGFLDTMRDTLFGGGPSRGSVPNVPPRDSRPVWNSGQAMQQTQPGYGAPPPYGQAYGQAPAPGYGAPPVGGGGGSFLGTAAAAADRTSRPSATPTPWATAALVEVLGAAATSPAARSRAMPASTTSAPAATAAAIPAKALSTRLRTTTRITTIRTTMTTTSTWPTTAISAAVTMAAAIMRKAAR
jgi:hypothetical protein